MYESHLYSGTPCDALHAQPRVLGLDLGHRRVGVAITDPLGLAAQPLLTMDGSNRKLLLKNLGRLMRKYEVAAVVVGHPLHLSGDISPQAAKAQELATALRDAFALPVHLQDERLSSVAAQELMDQLGLPRGPERTAKLDQYAAVVILQDWMDAQERQTPMPNVAP